MAHGFIVFAQRSIPIGTIGIMQVAQPALAVCWAYVFLGQSIRPVQLIGMALIVTGLVAVVTLTRRGVNAEARTAAAGAPDEPASTGVTAPEAR